VSRLGFWRYVRLRRSCLDGLGSDVSVWRICSFVILVVAYRLCRGGSARRRLLRTVWALLWLEVFEAIRLGEDVGLWMGWDGM
jgi:hypothetical protein